MKRPVLILAAVLLLAACGSSSPPPLAETPTAEELYAEGMQRLEGERKFVFFHRVNHQKAIDTFQEVIDNYPYSEYAVLAELKIADAYYDAGRYDEALSYYQDFPELHPKHERVPYTLLQAAYCHFERAEKPNRDQTATREALDQLDVLLSRYPYSQEAEEGEELWRDLRTRLAEHIMVIADFYMKRSEYQSAADRYRSLLNEYPGLGLDAEALYKLGVCYTEMHLEDEAQRIFQVILENYEGTDVAANAADLIPAAQ